MTARPVIDMLGRALLAPEHPQRIISLCPSQTETLFELGLGGRVVGSTRYCIHPASVVAASTRVGGTKKVDLETVRRLRPDLIIAEKEENPREMVEALSEISPVYVTEVVDPPSALEMIRRLGDLSGVIPAAEGLCSEIARAWSAIPASTESVRVAYLIWRKPWMAAGPTTYIDSLLQVAGFTNVFGASETPGARYPEFSAEQLAQRSPDVVLLSSEPYPFKPQHLDELREIVPGARVLLTDGEPWSWYGARMRSFPKMLQELRRELEPQQ